MLSTARAHGGSAEAPVESEGEFVELVELAVGSGSEIEQAARAAASSTPIRHAQVSRFMTRR
jgi:hypothetical protein